MKNKIIEPVDKIQQCARILRYKFPIPVKVVMLPLKPISDAHVQEYLYNKSYKDIIKFLNDGTDNEK